MKNNNSDDININNENGSIPHIDYKKTKPPIIDEIIKIEAEKLQRDAKISWDGRQYIVRIPKEISDIMNITKDNKIRFIVINPAPDEKEIKKMEMILL